MPMSELDHFIKAWEYEAQKTIQLLRALPVTQYDFRPDPTGRSLGELGWHLAEVDAYITYGIDAGRFDGSTKIPGLERPRTIEALAPGYERIHADSLARVRKLKPLDLERTMTFFDGSPMLISNLLWGAVLHHGIHHRGQLSLMCRLAGGVSPGLYGPNREATEMMRAARATARG